MAEKSIDSPKPKEPKAEPEKIPYTFEELKRIYLQAHPRAR